MRKRINRGILYIIPALIVIGFVMLYPLGYTLIMGFFKKTLYKPQPIFAGLYQFKKLLNDPIFFQSVKNTFVWTFGSVTFQFLIGFSLAMLLHQSFVKGKTLLRILLMIPWILPSIIGASDWKWMYNADYGIINYIFKSLHIIDTYQTWLSTPSTAMLSVIVVNVWKMFPFVILMIEASLYGVQKTLKEAALIDGAGYIKTFKVVVWPSISSTCYSIILLLTIWTLNAFTFIYALTLGGPAHSTEVLAMYIHNKAFTEFNFGYASAASTVLFGLSILTSLVYLYVTTKNED